MPTVPGVGLALLLVSGLLLLGFLTYGYWFKRRSDEVGSQTNQMDVWIAEAVSLVHQVEYVADQPEGPANQDQLRRQLLPLASQIRGHVRGAPKGTEQLILREFHDLGRECYTLSMEHTKVDAIESGVFLEEKLRELRVDAQRVEETLLPTHKDISGNRMDAKNQ